MSAVFLYFPIALIFKWSSNVAHNNIELFVISTKLLTTAEKAAVLNNITFFFYLFVIFAKPFARLYFAHSREYIFRPGSHFLSFSHTHFPCSYLVFNTSALFSKWKNIAQMKNRDEIKTKLNIGKTWKTTHFPSTAHQIRCWFFFCYLHHGTTNSIILSTSLIAISKCNYKLLS